MTDVLLLQGTYLGAAGSLTGTRPPTHGGGTDIAPAPRPTRWKLPIPAPLKPKPLPEITRVYGEARIPRFTGRGRARVINMSRGGGAAVALRSSVSGSAFALCRASGSAEIRVASIPGTAKVDAPDRSLAALLGLEGIEDFR